MLTRMTDDEWAIVLKVFEASRSRRGDKGRDDRKFLGSAALFSLFTTSTWRALPVHWQLETASGNVSGD